MEEELSLQEEVSAAAGGAGAAAVDEEAAAADEKEEEEEQVRMQKKVLLQVVVGEEVSVSVEEVVAALRLFQHLLLRAALAVFAFRSSILVTLCRLVGPR